MTKFYSKSPCHWLAWPSFTISSGGRLLEAAALSISMHSDASTRVINLFIFHAENRRRKCNFYSRDSSAIGTVECSMNSIRDSRWVFLSARSQCHRLKLRLYLRRVYFSSTSRALFRKDHYISALFHIGGQRLFQSFKMGWVDDGSPRRRQTRPQLTRDHGQVDKSISRYF